MTSRKTRRASADEMADAKARLKDMGAGLGSLFDTVSKLLEEARSDQPRSASQGRRWKTHMDVRVGTLDDVIAARHSPQRPAPKPYGSAAEPEAVEHHDTGEALMVIVTLGEARPADMTLSADQGTITLTCGRWSKQIIAGPGYDAGRAERIVRPGYLTFLVPSAQDTPPKQ
ncbi:MAG: hypothetical protein AAF337_00360 [Pseudomonadota bacterium]